MFLTVHTLAGVLLGRRGRVPTPALVPVGVVSHLALDAVPHFGAAGVGLTTPRGRAVAAVDCTLALAVGGAAVRADRPRRERTVAAILGATLPDLLYIPQHLLGIARPRWFFALHRRVQWAEFPTGLVIEVAFAGAFVRALARRRNPPP